MIRRKIRRHHFAITNFGRVLTDQSVFKVPLFERWEIEYPKVKKEAVHHEALSGDNFEVIFDADVTWRANLDEPRAVRRFVEWYELEGGSIQRDVQSSLERHAGQLQLANPAFRIPAELGPQVLEDLRQRGVEDACGIRLQRLVVVMGLRDEDVRRTLSGPRVTEIEENSRKVRWQARLELIREACKMLGLPPEQAYMYAVLEGIPPAIEIHKYEIPGLAEALQLFFGP